MAIPKQADNSVPVPEMWREHAMSTATFYKWRPKFGGMGASMMAHLKELEDENRRRMMAKQLLEGTESACGCLRCAEHQRELLPLQGQAQ